MKFRDEVDYVSKPSTRVATAQRAITGPAILQGDLLITEIILRVGKTRPDLAAVLISTIRPHSDLNQLSGMLTLSDLQFVKRTVGTLLGPVVNSLKARRARNARS